MIRLFLLYAILIFAKRAPKLIADLLKLKDDGIGLKGLNIKNKMGEAALVGDKVKKSMNSIEGKTKGTVGGAVGGFLRAKGGPKERLKAAAAGASKGYAKGKHDALENKDTKGIFGGAYKEMGDIASGGRTSFFNKPKDWLQQADDRIIKGVGGLGGHYTNPLTAENQIKLNGLKADLTKRYGADKANEMLKRAIKRTEDKYGKLNLSDEKQWMFLTKGKEWDSDNKKYIDSGIFKGINDAIDNPNSGSYTFDNSVLGNMNSAYAYSNVAVNIDKKRSAFDAAYQKYTSYSSMPTPQQEPGESDADFTNRLNEHKNQITMYRREAEDSFEAYRVALSKAGDALMVDTATAHQINGANMAAFAANQGGVDTKLSKQVSAFKGNADSAVQKEEIKQKTEDSSK